MKKYNINTCAFLFKVKGHKDFKKYMLNYINSQSINRLVERNDDISNTDWHLNSETNREYINKFSKLIEPYLKEMCVSLKASKFVIRNMWYQQYGKNSKHQWHYHCASDWSAVYYIDLPKDTGTQLYDIPKQKILDNFNLKEGDLFIFPANILHRSPPNKSDKIKTIISFNMILKQVTSILAK